MGLPTARCRFVTDKVVRLADIMKISIIYDKTPPIKNRLSCRFSSLWDKLYESVMFLRTILFLSSRQILSDSDKMTNPSEHLNC